MCRLPAASAAFLAVLCLPVHAAAVEPGAPDPSFGGGDGFTIVDIPVGGEARNNSATHVLVQPDGKVVLAGAAQVVGGCTDCSERMVAVRLTAAGATDGSFGSGGIARVDGLPGQDDEGYYDGRIGFAPDGDVYLFLGTQDDLGTIGWAAARLADSNAALVSAWGGDGRVDESTTGNAGDLAVQPDGKVVLLDDFAAGDHEMRVCRYEESGDLDLDFGDGGCRAVAFDLGTAKDDWARVLALHPDGRIVLGGGAASAATNTDFAVAVLTSGGDLDPTFGGDGRVTMSFGLAIGNHEEVRALGVDAQGRIWAGGLAGAGEGGNNNDCALARFLPNGDPDPAFGGGDGKVNFDYAGGAFEQIFGLALQGDGRVVVAGRGSNGGSGRRAGVARLTESGALDPTFSPADVAGAAVFDFSSAANTVGRAVTLAEDGSIVLSGYARYADNDFFAARLLNDYVFADTFEQGDLSAWDLDEAGAGAL